MEDDEATSQKKGKAGLLLELFGTFARIGVATFGGGYAMLPVIDREVNEKKHWATEQDLADYYAIGQCTPGAIAVNTATFVGYSVAGNLGGIVATLGVIFPSLVIICVIAAFLHNFSSIPAVEHAFAGIRACVTVLIFSSVIKIGKGALKDLFCWIVFGIVLVLSLFTDLSTPLLVIAAGIAGYIASRAKTKRRVK